MGKVFLFQDAVQKKREQSKQQNHKDCHYRCYVTTERLNGYCELLICEKNLKQGEWFSLVFSPEGLVRCTTLNGEGIGQWKQMHIFQEITYLQAIRLLGDAVRQRYKYQKSTEWIPEESSIHLKRIWQEEYYNDQTCEIGWLLPRQECAVMLETWFRALGNKDAVLLYDLSASQVQHEARRSVFAHCWTHTLEDMRILGYEVDRQSVRCNGADDYTLFLTVYGECCGTKIMEVDLRMRLIEEMDGFRILQDQVLESRNLYRKQYS